MKVFNIEHNKQVVYVQIKDLVLASVASDGAPKIVNSLVYDKYSEISLKDLNKFVRIEDPKAVSYFKTAIWCAEVTQALECSLVDTIRTIYDLYEESLADTLSHYLTNSIFGKDVLLADSRFDAIPNKQHCYQGMNATGYLSVNQKAVVIIFNNEHFLKNEYLVNQEISFILNQMNVDYQYGFMYNTVPEEGKVIVQTYKKKDLQRNKNKRQ